MSILQISKILAILAIAAITTYAGFTVDPQALKLQVNKGERVGWLEVSNTEDTPIAVELTVHKRVLDLEGNVIADSMQASNEFTIYPSQILLYPGKKAKAQIVLKGKDKITADKAYILYSKEVPFEFPAEEKTELNVGFNMKINYNTIISLETGKSANIDFVSSKALDSGKVEVIVENKSSGRFITSNLYIMAGGTKITDFTGKGNSIMPGQKRRFTFKHSAPLTAKEFRYGTQ